MDNACDRPLVQPDGCLSRDKDGHERTHVRVRCQRETDSACLMVNNSIVAEAWTRARVGIGKIGRDETQTDSGRR